MYCKSKMKQQTKFKKKIITPFFFSYLRSDLVFPHHFCHFLVPDSFWEAMFLVLTDKRCCLWQDKLSSLLSFFLSLISLSLTLLFPCHCSSFPLLCSPSPAFLLQCCRVGFSKTPGEAVDPRWVQGQQKFNACLCKPL